MASTDRDVFVCYGPPGEALARVIAEGLRGRGFRLSPADAVAALPDAARLALIEQAPDFVVVLPPASLEALQHPDDGVRAEMAHAVRTRRNVVQVRVPGEASQGAESVLAEIFAWRRAQAVVFDESRAAESVATVAHRLSSDATVDERRIMRRSKRLVWIAVGILLAGVALQEVPRLIERWSSPRLLAPIPPFAVSWAGIGQRLESGQWTEFGLGSETGVSRGDRLRLAFAPSADGHAYVVLRSAGGEVRVLFPTDSVRGASRVEAGKMYFAPVGIGWLNVEDPSAEGSLFLVAGYDPLHNLEELVDQPEASTSPAARRQLFDATIGGLLDGRHGATERRVWTGKLHPIDPALKWGAGPTAASVALADGGR